MKRNILAIVLGITLLTLCGCEEEEISQPKPLPLAVEGDVATKAAIEEMLKAEPEILYIPRRDANAPGDSTEYSIRIIEPDANIDYSILRVKPDPDTEYSMVIIDPRTQKPPTHIDPNAFLEAIADKIRERNQDAAKE
jgi:hypothetical protein